MYVRQSKAQDALLYANFLREVRAGLDVAAQESTTKSDSISASLGQSSRWRVTADVAVSATKCHST